MLFRLSILSIISGLVLFSVYSEAGVTGQCSNCHTMHNSQAGVALAFYYNESTKALVTESSTPNPGLLVSDCVGCHTSSGSGSIKDLGGSQVPIVLNTTLPTAPLAGGNFYWVSQGPLNDNYGHNVWGISGVDSKLAEAPANTSCSANNNSCHVSLATDPDLTHGKISEGNYLRGRNGCEACHQSMKHHGDTITGNNLETDGSGWYRFLSGHEVQTNVYGIESPDWEQNPANNNKYQGVTGFYFPGDKQHTITGFCRGCHVNMHFLSSSGGSHVSPWYQHPTDAALPETVEYAYDPVTAYDPQVPVAWVNPLAPVRAEAVVMCLSCHRAHGSEYPNMLRWDYRNWPGAGYNGCGVCHSTKN